MEIEKVDDLRLSFSTVSFGIEAENGLADQLRILKSRIEKVRSLDSKLDEFGNRIQAVLIELEDIAEDAIHQLELLEIDPKRQELLTGYIDRFQSLLRKHNVHNQADLMALETQFQQKLDAVEHADDQLLELKSKVDHCAQELESIGAELFSKRLESAVLLERYLQSLLADLKLPDARLQFRIERNEVPDNFGGMSIQFLFSANTGMEMKSIERAASGGELSRLMLAIQSTLSSKSDLPTLILDEIDTGVSGEVALRIGKMLSEMGTNLQLFGITHLPQVAAKGQHHFEVSKLSTENETNTTIRLLSHEERIDAIAKLMSGEQITAASKENAMSLMQ